MKNIVAILLLSLVLSGCSLLKIASQPFKNTVSKVPEKTEKANRQISCSGEITLDSFGRVIKCENNYRFKESTFNQQERKLGWREKVSQFVLNVQGYLFWGTVLLIVFAPGALGLIIGRAVESTFGISKKALSSTVRAIQKVRKLGEDINISLSSEQDEKIKKYIRKLKENEKIK